MKKRILYSTLLILVAFRIYLPTLLKNYANKELNQDPVYHGHIEDVKVHLWRGAYAGFGFKIEEVKGQKLFPLISAEQIDVGVSWRELFHGALVAKMWVKNLEVNIVQELKPEGKKIILGVDSKEGKRTEARGWQTVFKNLVPLDVSSLSVDGGSIHFRDLTIGPKVNIFIDQLEVRAYNLTNSKKVSQSLFGSVDMKARVGESGALNVKLLINPLVSPIEFKATTTLKNLDLTRLNGLFTAYENIDVKTGQFSLYSEVATANNNVKGYIKPIIQNLKVADFKKDEKKGAAHAFKEEVVGFVAWILKNFPKKRQAAIIPFEGKLDQPKINGWAIAKSILHNMFVKAIAPQIDNSVKLKDLKR